MNSTYIFLIILFIVISIYLYRTKESFGSTTIIYNFNTEWCGYSKRFQPIWDKFSKQSPIKALDIKCDKKENNNMCKKFNVPGYPSVILVKDGKHIQYKGPRTLEALLNFVRN